MSWLRRFFGQEEAPEGTFAGSERPPPPPREAALPGPGDVVSGRLRFVLGALLGEGSYGAVYTARVNGEAEGVPDEVAVKVLSLRLPDPLRDEALRAELSSLLALDHPAIPRLYDWSLDGARPFVALERFAQGSLSAHLARQGALDERALLRLMGDLLGAVRVASRAGLLHLDIKPDNVLLRDDGGFALADFGTARAAWSSSGDRAVEPRGSQGYRAPEQNPRDQGDLDLRTDLFGVGATVWAAATGIDLASPRGLSLLVGHRHEPVALPPVRSLRPMAPPLVDEVLQTVLARDPAARPSDPADVLESLRRGSQGGGHTLQSRGRVLSADEADAVRAALLDPLWAHVLAGPWAGELRAFSAGTVLVEDGEPSHHALVLLQGTVAVQRAERVLAQVQREGAFLGEVAALTGGVRTAQLTAETDVVALVLDLMALEALVSGSPAVGMRLLHAMAERLAANVG